MNSSDHQANCDAQVYSAYGLAISFNHEIHGLFPQESSICGTPDVSIRFVERKSCPLALAESKLWYTTDIKDEDGNPALKIWRHNRTGDFSIRYTNGLTFEVDSSLTTLSVYGANSLSDGDVSAFLLGPVLGILLRLKGFICLHASAVAFDGKALVFTGAEGFGKSTTAALFARRGHAVLADDIAALELMDRRIRVRPGYPMLNLLSDSVKLLFGSEDALPAPDPAMGKRQMVLGEGPARFQGEPLDLGAVVVLDDAPGQTGIHIERLMQKTALIELVSRTYANKMLDSKMRAAEFQFLTGLVISVPVLRLTGLFSTPDLGVAYRSICDAAAAAMKLQTHATTA